LAELEKLQGQIDAENTQHTEFGNALSDAPSAPLFIIWCDISGLATKTECSLRCNMLWHTVYFTWVDLKQHYP
jgi:hypothetical protein